MSKNQEKIMVDIQDLMMSTINPYFVILILSAFGRRI